MNWAITWAECVGEQNVIIAPAWLQMCTRDSYNAHTVSKEDLVSFKATPHKSRDLASSTYLLVASCKAKAIQYSLNVVLIAESSYQQASLIRI